MKVQEKKLIIKELMLEYLEKKLKKLFFINAYSLTDQKNKRQFSSIAAIFSAYSNRLEAVC
jgi:hypothetical protein